MAYVRVGVDPLKINKLNAACARFTYPASLLKCKARLAACLF